MIPITQVIEVNSVRGLQQAVWPSAEQKQAVWFWRGQANCNWKIENSAWRRHENYFLQRNENLVRRYERDLLGMAKAKGFQFHDGVELNDFELLARLQHHGAATRLIDVSRSAFVGAYFACAGSPSEDGLLVGIHSNYIGGYETRSYDEPYQELVESIADLDHPMVLNARSVTPRIAAQHAQFIFGPIVETPIACVPLEPIDKAVLGIRIKSKAKPKILEFLKSCCDIHYWSLFPDFDGFALANGPTFGICEHERW